MRKLFLEIGYTEEETNNIINSYIFKKNKPETLINKVNNNYNYLLSLGYSKEEIIKITKNSPAIYMA